MTISVIVTSAHGQRERIFDRLESHTVVVAGLVPATQNVKAQSENDRGGRDQPGHDPDKDQLFGIIA
jgi:hypothetical protein